jgi:hypothetical protein
MLGSSWITAQLVASQEGLSSMSEWVVNWANISWPFLSIILPPHSALYNTRGWKVFINYLKFIHPPFTKIVLRVIQHYVSSTIYIYWKSQQHDVWSHINSMSSTYQQGEFEKFWGGNFVFFNITVFWCVISCSLVDRSIWRTIPGLHGATFQKTVFFLSTAVRTVHRSLPLPNSSFQTAIKILFPAEGYTACRALKTKAWLSDHYLFVFIVLGKVKLVVTIWTTGTGIFVFSTAYKQILRHLRPFLGAKAAEAWSWIFISICCRG